MQAIEAKGGALAGALQGSTPQRLGDADDAANAIQQVWIVSLVVFVVVLVVVAVLLTLILATAKQIRAGVSAIWNVGQKVANNTIHLALLDRTNHIAGKILESAGGRRRGHGRHRAARRGVSGLPAVRDRTGRTVR